MKPVTAADRLIPAARQEPAGTTTATTATTGRGLVAIPHGEDTPSAAAAGVWLPVGVWSPVSAAEVDAIADLLRRPPVQRRSKDRVAAILDVAAQTSRDPELTTTTVAERCGMSIGAVYQFFAGLDTVLACVGAVWMRRTITATARAAAAGEASTPDQLAWLLIGHLDAYRCRYRPPVTTEAAIRARAEREHAWHRQLATTLASPITPPGEDGPDAPALLDARCLIAVTLADRAARAAVQAAVHTAAGGDGRDLFVAEMARMVAGAVQLATHGG